MSILVPDDVVSISQSVVMRARDGFTVALYSGYLSSLHSFGILNISTAQCVNHSLSLELCFRSCYFLFLLACFLFCLFLINDVTNGISPGAVIRSF